MNPLFSSCRHRARERGPCANSYFCILGTLRAARVYVETIGARIAYIPVVR